jgi:hypothetical protein
MNFVSSRVAPAKLDFLTVMRSLLSRVLLFAACWHCAVAPCPTPHAKPGRAVRTMGGAHIPRTHYSGLPKKGVSKYVRSRAEAGGNTSISRADMGGWEILKLPGACIKTTPENEFIIYVPDLEKYLPSGSERIKIMDGLWGPWPKKKPTYLEPMPNQLSRPVSWHKDHGAVFPWVRMQYSASNLYHALVDVQTDFVQFVGSLREHQRKCGRRDPVVVLRQQLARNANIPNVPSVELSLAAASSGVFNFYQLDKTALSCFREIWVKAGRGAVGAPMTDGDGHCQIPKVGPRTLWRRDLGLGDEVACPNTRQQVPSVTIIERLSSRHITNVVDIKDAMLALGWNVRVVNLECMTMDEQFAAMQHTTTLIGYHGAGLTWSRLLPGNAASVQVIGFPCSFESHSSMQFTTRYTILHSNIRDGVDGRGVKWQFPNQSAAEAFCGAVRKKNKDLTNAEAAAAAGRSLDVRKYNATLNVTEVIETVRGLDPVLNPPGKCTSPTARAAPTPGSNQTAKSKYAYLHGRHKKKSGHRRLKDSKPKRRKVKPSGPVCSCGAI